MFDKLTRQKLISRIAFMVTFFVCPPWFAAAKEYAQGRKDLVRDG